MTVRLVYIALALMAFGVGDKTFAAVPDSFVSKYPSAEVLTTPGKAVDACLIAIDTAEKRYHIPPGLLLAIARTESGRLDPRAKAYQPWPWTVNAGGVGIIFASLPEAAKYVANARKRGVTSIDTGCLQVNLQQHPDAFPTLEDAFEPMTNADYAARFLIQLHTQTGDWDVATGYYHSHTAALAESYRASVRSIGLISRPAPVDAAALARATMLQALKSAWAATLPSKADGTTMSGWPITPTEPLPKPRERPSRLALRD